jgi:hypothetical protein
MLGYCLRRVGIVQVNVLLDAALGFCSLIGSMLVYFRNVMRGKSCLGCSGILKARCAEVSFFYCN